MENERADGKRGLGRAPEAAETPGKKIDETQEQAKSRYDHMLGKNPLQNH